MKLIPLILVLISVTGVLGAEPSLLPKPFKDYFERIDEVRATHMKSLEKKLVKLRADVKTAKFPQKSHLGAVIIREERLLEQYRLAKLTDEIFLDDGGLPRAKSWPLVMKDIGTLPNASVVIVADEKTLVVKSRAQKTSFVAAPEIIAVITPIDTRQYQAGERFLADGLFQVTAIDDPAKPGPEDSRFNEIPLPSLFKILVTPVKPEDVQRYRELYDVEKKRNEQNAARAN